NREETVRSTLEEAWKETAARADWDEKAARALIDLILPSTPCWLDKTSGGGKQRVQGVHLEPYWQRVLNEEIGPDEVVRDQEVARDITQWRKSPSEESPLIQSLCSSKEYCTVWERLAKHYWKLAPAEREPGQEALSQATQFLRLSQQVISHICKEHGSAASKDSQGFISVWRCASEFDLQTENYTVWLKERIEEAMSVSLKLVNDLFRYWGSVNYWFLGTQDRDKVRCDVLELAKEQLSDATSLMKIIDPNYPYSIRELVFLPGDKTNTSHRDIDSWKWLGPVMLKALRQKDRTIALEIQHLVEGASRKSTLQEFFGDEWREVEQLLENI
ncbi:MAG: hypothetical protein ACWGMZ_03755, partial [Thermoguttaceae bacterium]